jgi:hypothetical protein
LDQLLESDRFAPMAEAIARVESRQLEARHGTLAEHEFRVYSHAGEDGIIQYLIRRISVSTRTFVEFGVEDYREANTRFLLTNNHWAGLVLDGSEANIKKIKSDPLYWNSDLRAVQAFVTRDNINELLEANHMSGDLGLLSIDVDGNDYWIFDAVHAASPSIAVIEYNHRFGPERAVTIPYDPAHVRRQTDLSWLFSGASLKAIVLAAQRKGLAFVGCNTFGNNAFFLRRDLLPSWLPPLSAEDGFVAGRFRESVILEGRLIVPGPEDERSMLEDVELVTVA